MGFLIDFQRLNIWEEIMKIMTLISTGFIGLIRRLGKSGEKNCI